MTSKSAFFSVLIAASLNATACLPTPDISVSNREPSGSESPLPPSFPQTCSKPSYPLENVGNRAGNVINPTILLRDESGTFSVESLYDPCSAQTGMLVLRLMTSWCGACQWQAAHTTELVKSGAPGRVQVLDVLNKDQHNIDGPSMTALAEFRHHYDSVPRVVTDEPSGRAASYFEIKLDGKYRFPLIAVINRKTMRFVEVLADPDPDRVLEILRQEMAREDGLPPPPPLPATLYDGRFSRARWELIQGMRIGPSWQPPPDPTNKYEANSDAVTLGRALFFDEGLSSAGTIGCVTCHAPATAFADGRQTARGLAPDGTQAIGDRNTPWLGGIGTFRFQFWDGRIDSLWAQALGPFENDKEISSNRLHVIRESLSRYRTAYEKVFGSPPDLSDTTRFPLNARPGMAAWAAMTAADRDTVNRVYSNLGKAIAAYERQIRPQRVAIDRYADGDLTALSSDEKDGLVQFFEVGCAQCHHGPMLSDGALHVNYFPTGRVDGYEDVGRLSGLPELLANDFRGNGPYSDDVQAATWLRDLAPSPSTRGQFRTMPLRGIADTAPYTHGGQVKTLRELITLYAEGGLPDGDPRTTGVRDLGIVKFDKDDPKNDLLVKFLLTFKATVTAP